MAGASAQDGVCAYSWQPPPAPPPVEVHVSQRTSERKADGEGESSQGVIPSS